MDASRAGGRPAACSRKQCRQIRFGHMGSSNSSSSSSSRGGGAAAAAAAARKPTMTSRHLFYTSKWTFRQIQRLISSKFDWHVIIVKPSWIEDGRPTWPGLCRPALIQHKFRRPLICHKNIFSHHDQSIHNDIIDFQRPFTASSSRLNESFS